MAGLVRLVWRWTAAAIAGLIILSAILVGIFRVIVAQVPEYRVPVEEAVSSAIGLPFQIDQLDARWGLGGPEVLFNGVQIHGHDGATLLSARRGNISLDVGKSIMGWRLVWDTVTLDRVQAGVTRGEDGELQMLETPLSEFESREPGKLPDGSLRLRNSTLVVTDRMDGGVEWVFSDVNLDVSRNGDETRVEGDFRPPPEVADRVMFWADREEGDDRWRAYASLNEFDFGALNRIPGVPENVPTTGRADFRIWVDLEQQQLARLTAEFSVDDLVFEPREDRPPGGYDLLSGRVEWDSRPSGWQALVENLQIVRDGVQDTSERIRVERSIKSVEGDGTFYVDADYLRLESFGPLIPYVSDVALRENLEQLQPHGEIRGLAVQLTVPEDSETGWGVEIEAEVNGGSVQTHERIPGIRGLSGTLRSDGRGGRLTLDSRNFAVDMPWLFREPLVFSEATGLLVWSKGPEGLVILGDEFNLSNPDLALNTGLRVRLPSGDDGGNIDLHAEVVNLDMSRVSPYLPVGIMTEGIVGWLDNAIVSGRAASSTVVIQGPLKGFPYRDGQGTFEANLGATNLELAYATDWPAATGISANVSFVNEGLSATVTEGALGEIAVDTVEVQMPDLAKGMLDIKGTAQGTLAATMDYVRATPLPPQLLGGLRETTVHAGQARAMADLLLPIGDLENRIVDINLDITDGNVVYGKLQDPLENIDGRLHIDATSMDAQGITATLLGEPITIDVAEFEDKALRANVRGPLTSRMLIDAIGLPLSGYLEGASTWTGYAHFPSIESGDAFYIHLESDLDGMEIKLPEPLNKETPERKRLAIDFTFPEESIFAWDMSFDEEMNASMIFRSDEEGLHFDRGTVRGDTTQSNLGSDKGLFIRGEFQRFSIDEWLAVDFGGESDAAVEDLIAGAEVRIANLVAASQHISDATVKMDKQGTNWRVDLDSEASKGEIVVPFDIGLRQSPMNITMERLTLDDDEEDGSDQATKPGLVPPMRIQVETFSMHGLNLGRLETEIVAITDGFEMPSIQLSGPTFTITGMLKSVLGPTEDHSQMSAELVSEDVGDTLSYMGFESGVDAKKGKLSIDLEWTGGMPSDFVGAVRGTAVMNIDDGSLTEVKPGAGRAVGLLSVDALPRRLTLDFRDVFKKGFFFDKLKGDFAIADGSAYTDNLVLRSPAADIGIAGNINLVDRTYDQTALVSGEVGNTLPVVGAIAAGPVIGAG
ncbi:MAG: YhdP family protein, partial [Gammaproteobacteria bacterium]